MSQPPKIKETYVFNQETTIGITTRLGTSQTTVLRRIRRLRESLEIARYGPEWANLRPDVSLLNVF